MVSGVVVVAPSPLESQADTRLCLQADSAGPTPTVPPKLVVHELPSGLANRQKATELARRTPDQHSLSAKERERPISSEWVDIEASPPRRRRLKRSAHRHERVSKESYSDLNNSRVCESELDRFFPRLSRIVEGRESVTSARSNTRGLEGPRRRDREDKRRPRRRHDTSAVDRRPVKHRTADVPRRIETLLRINPSLLSVLTSLTGTSERSSGSSSTLTQQSYDRRGGHAVRSTVSKQALSTLERQPSVNTASRVRSGSVFDYIMPPAIEDCEDGRSTVSSGSPGSSHYDPSDAGSSEAPGTPSSRSTIPSPTITRSQSVAELRKKYDGQSSPPNGMVRSDSHSPQQSIRSVAKQPSVSDVDERDEEHAVVETTPPSPRDYDCRARSCSRSSKSSRQSNGRLHQQEESRRQHMTYAAQTHQHHYIDPTYGQHRSYSASSTFSDRSAQAYHMAMQQYRWPSPQAALAIPPQAMHGHAVQTNHPPAPHAPDLGQRTLIGYELMATKLSSKESPVKPLYRKFEYLNHRILLHLQDELCEFEEQLRHIDEVIAQMDPALVDGQHTPASRRSEAYYGTEIHQRRTSLLGRIFLKTEQYNRAMSAYAAMTKDSSSADTAQVREYQDWMAKHAPVHEAETRFLHRAHDLIIPGKPNTTIDHSPKHTALAYLPVVLMSPLLVFSLIPTFSGRLVVTAQIAVCAFLVAASTCVRTLMPPREWAMCVVGYVVLMAAIAGCIPQHSR